MSTLATVTVNQCDGCNAIASLQTDEDYASFETNWFDGWRTHFCSECKDKPEHAAAIADDGKVTEQLREIVGENADRAIQEIHGK